MSDPFGAWRKLAVFQSCLTGALGVGCLAIPSVLLTIFGCEPAPGAVLFLRAFGSSLLFVSVVHFALRDTRDGRLVRYVALANSVEDGLLGVFSLLAVLDGTLGATGWVLVGSFTGEVALNLWAWSWFRSSDRASASVA